MLLDESTHERIVIYSVDRYGKLLSWNQAYADLYTSIGVGISRGFDTLQFLDPADASLILSDIQNAFSGATFKIFRQFIFNNQAYRALLTYVPQVNGGGEIISCVKILGRDFTDSIVFSDDVVKTRLFKSLLKSSRNQHLSGALACEIVVCFNENLDVTFACDYSANVMHPAANRFTGKNLTEIVAKQDLQKLKGLISSLQDNSEESIFFEGLKLYSTDHEFAFYDGIIGDYLHEEDVQGYIVWLFDITRRKKAEDHLQEINSELDHFIYHASHDIRAPLLTILGLVNVALYDEEKNSQRYLNMIKDRINKVDHFINDLSLYFQNERREVRVVSLPVRTMISDLLDSLKHLKNYYRITFDLKTTIDYIQSDSFRLKAILRNLLTNSIQFSDLSKDTCELNMTITSYSRSYEITVEDNGIGISEEHHEQVFDMFYRATEKSTGSGLGLSVAKKIVSKLKGEIEITSVLHKGTRVTVVLPKPVQPNLIGHTKYVFPEVSEGRTNQTNV